MNNEKVNIKISQDEIAIKVKEAGKLISEEYKNACKSDVCEHAKPILLVSVLKGAFVFLADLCRELTIPCEIAFISSESYVGAESSGNIKITLDIKQDISQYHVLIVEDIIDTGQTLPKLIEILKKRKPMSLKTITLLDKPERRVTDFKADYVLFTIPDYFAVGYGLDCDEQYRNLPYIAEIIT